MFIPDQRRLAALGLSAESAEQKYRLLGRCDAAAKAGLESARTRPGPAPIALFVPGRLEALGKHTDYGGGRSLVGAIERGFVALAFARDDSILRLLDAGQAPPAEARCPVDPEITPIRVGWANYPMTVARRVARNFPGPLRGADVYFCSDLPPAAGISSSSALVTLTFLALREVNRLDERDEYRSVIPDSLALASYLGAVESGQSFGPLAGDGGVGTFGGSEDHAAILCSSPRRLGLFSYCPTRLERSVPFPSDRALLIACSGVVAEKTGEARDLYNRVSARLQRVQQLTCPDAPSLADFLRGSPASADAVRSALRAGPDGANPGELLERFEHFLIESEQLVPAAALALDRGDLPEFGRLCDRSQWEAQCLLHNNVAETDALASSARRLGAEAASAFGAGFGGSVWAIVPSASADDFARKWADAYRRQFGARAAGADFFQTRLGPAAGVIELEG